MPAYRTRDTPVRSLEVTVADALEAAPALNIVSPTPRAFTFPPHAHAPSLSPANSPFEPDLRTLTITPAAALASSTSTPPPDSLQSSPAAPAPAPSHRRRRSTASDIHERRPKRGDDDYIKRPENAFILFRRKCCEDRNSALDEGMAAGAPVPKKQRQADLSKAISAQWRSLPAEEKQYWEDLAKEKKKEHAEMHPNYVYRPIRLKKGKASAAASAKGKGRSEDEPETDGEIAFTLPVAAVPSRTGRRAVSAPTPPPAYQQTIQIPALFMPSPTSPLEVAMISHNNRRTSAPSTLESELGWTFPASDDHDHADFGQPQGWQPDPQADDVFSSVYELSLSHMGFEPPKRAIPLDPLTIPNEPTMYIPQPATSLVSPVSYRTASSGTSSPHLGPFTPGTLETVQLPTDLWQQHSDMHMVPAPLSGSDPSSARMHPHPHPHQQLAYHTAYAGWGDLWPANAQPLFNEDFDLSLIPPITMDVPKFEVGCEERGTSMYDAFAYDGMGMQMAMTADGY